ncbi:hypothetical protein SprV_0100282500 [Sparganum proliferum]
MAVDQPGDLGGRRPEQTSTAKRNEGRRSHIRRKPNHRRQSQKRGSRHKCRPSATSNMPALESVSSDTMRQRPDNVYLLSHSRPCRKPRTHRHPRPRRHHPLCPNPCIDRSDQYHRHHDFTQPPPPPPPMGRLMSHYLLPSPPTLPPPVTMTWFIPVPTAIAHSRHTSAICESITETGEPLPGAPTYTRRTRLHCPHCSRTFTHRPLGHMCIHESGIHRSLDTPSTPTMPSPTHTLSPIAPTISSSTTAITDSDTADLSCSHCPRTFTSRVGVVGLLPIHRTETGEPVTGALTYTRRIVLHCPH